MATAAEHVRYISEIEGIKVDLSSEVEQIRIQNIRAYLRQPITLLLEADSAELAGLCSPLSGHFLRASAALRNRATPLEEETYECILALEYLGSLLRKVRGAITFEASTTLMSATLDLRRKLHIGSQT